jgi:hypothetical protein
MRKALSLGLVAVVAAGAFAPAVAAPKKPKPMTGSFAATGLPVPASGEDPTDTASSCSNSALEGISITSRTIKTAGAGTLAVQLSGFIGDWDITILDANGDTVAAGDNASAAGTAMSTGEIVERASVKYKKASTIKISVCNFAGGPTAEAKYTYTYK